MWASWDRRFPELLRVGITSLVVATVAMLAHYTGQPIQWEIAIIYGVFYSVSGRWPIMMPVTGIRMVLAVGLLLQALMRYGLLTSLIVLLVEFVARLVVTPRNRSGSEWAQLMLGMGALTLTAGLMTTTGPAMQDVPHVALTLISAHSVVQAYIFWAILNLLWTFVTGPSQAPAFIAEFLLRSHQSWWWPLAQLLFACLVDMAYLTSMALVIPACLLLTWAQYWIGTIFTTIVQDKAVAELLRSSGQRSSVLRRTYHRVLCLSQVLARELELSEQEVRVIGYAALLQESLSEPNHELPLWFAEPLTPEQVLAVQAQMQSILWQMQRTGVLREMGLLIQFRHASYDGKGYPPVVGSLIPIGAQVLSAANAIVWLVQQADDTGDDSVAKAVFWIHEHAAHRFGSEVLDAMMRALGESEMQMDRDDTLPNTVRQLQDLVLDEGYPSTLVTGFRRMWYHLRRKTELTPGLPAEVLAVARMASYFAASTGIDQTANVAVTAVGELLGAKVALALALASNDRTDIEMVFKASYGIHHLKVVGKPLAVYGELIRRAILQRIPVQMADIREMNSTLTRELARMEGVRSALLVPLVGRGRTIGLMLVGMVQPHWFTPREIGLIHLMAGQAATALENAKLMTEVAKRLEHISALKAFTDTLLDNLSPGIIVVDPEGRLTLANAAAQTIFAPCFSLQTGQPLPQGHPMAPHIYQALDGSIEAGIDIAWGSIILEIQTARLQDGGGAMIGAIGLARDVTKVRAMEQQVRRVEKLAAMGELAAGAAHEIRNPLTSIRGFIQLMQDRASSTEGEFMQIILNEIDRIDAIIRDLLLLARPTELQRAEISLADLADELLMLHQCEWERHGIAVIKEFDTEVGLTLFDPKMFRQLLLNLIMNALQAMPYGGTLRISICREGSEHLIIAFSDTGVGISQENMKRVFEPFFTTKEHGTGLGLALCYGIVQAHHGRIDVQSAEGVGTTFTITLPLAPHETASD